MFRNTLILTLLLPLLLSADIIKGKGAYTTPEGESWEYDPWPLQGPPTPEKLLPGAMWIVSSAINNISAEIAKQSSQLGKLDDYDKAINDLDTRLNKTDAALRGISATAQQTGSGGGILQIKDWPLSAVLEKGAIDTDHGITVKTVDTTGNITSSSGSVIADIITGRTGITTPGWIQANGNITGGTLTSGGGIAAGGKITGVSEPTAGSDAATKAYVDNAVTNVGAQEVVVYMLSGSTSSDTFSLVPVRLVGVKLGAAETGGAITFTRKTITESIGITSDAITSRQFSGFTVNSTSSDSGPSIPLVDHGSFPQ